MAYFSKLTAAIGRKTSVWTEISRLKSEIRRSGEEAHLLEREIEELKKEAGASAYEQWSTGTLSADSLTEYFEKVNEREINIGKQRVLAANLEGEIRKWKEKKVQEKGGKEEFQNPEPRSVKLSEADTSLVCHHCQTPYRTTANFCRKCGARLDSQVTEDKNT